MRRRLLGASLLMAALVAVPIAEVHAQKKKGDDKPAAKPVDSAKLKAGEYAGTLKSVPGNDRVFLVELESTSVVPTGVQRGNRFRPATVKTKTVTSKAEIEFQASEKVRVRTKALPEAFDEKGNIKKYTREELAALRGKDSRGLPGYESSLDRLSAGQKVSVVLAAAPAKKDKDGGAVAEKKMQVKMIVILSESSGDAKPMGKGKKKK
jgi:hypothetical protein